MAFVRLDEAVLLESVLEVPVPVRFIFVLLGPSQSSVDYHEIGRSFSTLMSDKVHDESSRRKHFKLLLTYSTITNGDIQHVQVVGSYLGLGLLRVQFACSPCR